MNKKITTIAEVAKRAKKRWQPARKPGQEIELIPEARMHEPAKGDRVSSSWRESNFDGYKI